MGRRISHGASAPLIGISVGADVVDGAVPIYGRTGRIPSHFHIFLLYRVIGGWLSQDFSSTSNNCSEGNNLARKLHD
jgi:hypothetical protein